MLISVAKVQVFACVLDIQGVLFYLPKASSNSKVVEFASLFGRLLRYFPTPAYL